jgi:tetratricopeptide (TPR) repeat protein
MKKKDTRDRKKKRPDSSPSTEEHKSESPSLPGKHLLIAGFLIAAVTFIVFLPALGNDFVNWDDHQFIYENPHIRSLDKASLKWMFTNQETQWSPLRFLTHAIDYQLWGLNPMGHHLTNIIFHGLNAFLVVLLIGGVLTVAAGRGIGVNQPEDTGFGRRVVIAAVVGGLLFGIHPLRVESVVWVSERKDVLYGFFYLLSLLMYLKYVSGEEVRRRYYYAGCLVLFVLSLMSKAMAVTLPLVLLVLDFYPLQRVDFRSILQKRAVFIEKIPFFALSIAAALLQLRVHEEMGAVRTLEASPLSDRIPVAFKALWFYLSMLIWPNNFAPLHPYPKGVTLFSPEYIWPFLLVLVITVYCIHAWKRGRIIWLAVWAYFVVTLLPVLGIVRAAANYAGERYTYMSSIGPVLLAGIGISLLWERTYMRDKGILYSRKLFVIALALIVSLLSMMTVQQIGIWKNSGTLWTYELEKYPDNEHALHNRSIYLIGSGDYASAIKDIDRIIELYPDFGEEYMSYTNRCGAYEKLGEFELALKDCTMALKQDPQNIMALYNRGAIYVRLGENKEAIRDFQKAAQLGDEEARELINKMRLNW